MIRPDWAPPDIDLDTPSIARVYDYWVGGTHNLPVDRVIAERLESENPVLPMTLRSNRAFLRRAVRELSSLGVDQFLDIGAGIPTEGNVHEVALECNPSSRVVYVDIDPVAVSHGRAILADEPRATSIQGDFLRPGEILTNPEVRAMLDPDRPIALVLAAILHFVPDQDHPRKVLDQYLAHLAPGSFLVISHAGIMHRSDETGPPAPEATEQYKERVSDAIRWRDAAALRSLCSGLDIIEPGVTPVPLWRPCADDPPDEVGTDAVALALVARKP
ncbi:SAM-dependent methyltransferase [Actinomadura sp. 3N508]|uniref:SAM-dependent methyltransferase n=1 Tax=Actinomadura sp. 3N508 TaxID=3375153 RepID=UPI0037B9604C